MNSLISKNIYISAKNNISNSINKSNSSQNKIYLNSYEKTNGRKLDFEYAKNVPIVAMTADAFSENVADCFAAGMNGHIAKPIDLNLVLAEIRKIKNK